ncbi:hypothetical protein [Pseudonocardia charpentierae]|uniref:FtsK domain-containing protein n=1 Tax=Pseudonocardia charpentierae TaxID=3075545 RepID=A0ABU2NIE2_9PSEU|nr:hypothetical protein [Pseudonocardia sp. DSM 45834]MDT0353726.1 hypothetical protein [Pseudonocardia sp. DSM 45834]
MRSGLRATLALALYLPLAALDGLRELWARNRWWRSVADLAEIEEAAREKRDVRMMAKVAEEVGAAWHHRRSVTRQWVLICTVVAVIAWFAMPRVYLAAVGVVVMLALAAFGAVVRRAWVEPEEEAPAVEPVMPPWPGLSGDLRGAVPIGYDPDTGKVMELPLGHHVLVAGQTGSGKSMLVRVLAAGALLGEDVDTHVWSAKQCDDYADLAPAAASYGVGRSAMPALADVLDGVVSTVVDGGGTGRRTVLVLDEVASAFRHDEVGERIRSAVVTLAELGRGAKVTLVVVVQRVTKKSLPPEIVDNCPVVIGLRVGSAGASRLIFGEDAGDLGLAPHLFDEPGWAWVNGVGPKPRKIRGWMLDAQTASSVVARALTARDPDGFDSVDTPALVAARVVPQPSLLDDVSTLIADGGVEWAPTRWLAFELTERWPDRHPTRETAELGRLLQKSGCRMGDFNRPWQGGPRRTYRGVTAEDVETARKRR